MISLSKVWDQIRQENPLRESKDSTVEGRNLVMVKSDQMMDTLPNLVGITELNLAIRIMQWITLTKEIIANHQLKSFQTLTLQKVVNRQTNLENHLRARMLEETKMPNLTAKDSIWSTRIENLSSDRTRRVIIPPSQAQRKIPPKSTHRL